MTYRVLELRDYQQAILGKLREAFIAGHRAVVLVAPTGAGKTEMAMDLLGAAADNGKRAAMVLDRVVLCNQTSARLDSYGIDHGVMQAGHWRFRPAERIQVCSAQTLEKRGSMPGMKLLIVDECFPGETMIDTLSGPRRIDTLCTGERIKCATGVGVIKSVFRTTSAKTVVMRLSNGTRIECTPDHPIFTGMGWRPAGSVAVGTKLFREQDVRALWGAVRPEGVRAGDEQGASGGERDAVLPKAVLREILREEASEPDGLTRDAAQGGEHPAQDRACTSGKGGERKGRNAARAGAVREVGGWLGTGICGQDAAATGAGLSASLQAGLGAPAQDALHRAGWGQSRDEGQAGAGPEEGRSASQPWVESVEVVERESAQPVFNLRVSEHPSYFANGVLVHNCHNTRKQTVEFIKNNPGIYVVGLTATPFTKGLGKIYSSVVSAISTRELVERDMLVPLRVYIAKEIDMAGAKKVAGEWSSAEAEERGIKITGDVVAEWVKKTHEVFGGPRKTVVFAAGVKHAADLAQKFSEAGYNFVSLSYKDDDEFKAEAIREFAKPDSSIMGLVATDILTKGFDVPDVMIGVSARPFTKSLSSHIQQMGRVMRKHPEKQFALWLDHSGNYVRFAEDWEDIYANGITSLDDGREKPKREPTEREKEAAKCPRCNAFWPGRADACACCGFVRPQRNNVTEQPGELAEYSPAGKKLPGRDERQAFYSQLLGMAEARGYKRGWAFHKYVEKFGVEPKGLNHDAAEPGAAVQRWVRSRQIAWANSRRNAANQSQEAIAA